MMFEGEAEKSTNGQSHVRDEIYGLHMTQANDIDYRQRWEAYASIWKLDGADAKRAACEKALRPDCIYRDPLTERKGWEDLIQYMVEFHQQVPGGHFVTQYFNAHHGRSIARWNMVSGDGTVLGEGISHGEYSDDGRLRAMTGFFEPAE